MSIPTTERLAQAMEQAGCPADGIAMARQGYYDDFKSPLATPIVQLVSDLRANGFLELAQRAMDGEFDSTPEESAAWFESEGRAMLSKDIADIIGGTPPGSSRPKPKGFG